MPIMISKEKRKIYIRKIKGFWEEYSRNKMGMASLILLIFFIFLAVFGPNIAMYSINERDLAEKWAVPEWATYIVPGWRDLPRTMHIYYDNAFLAEPKSDNVEMTRDFYNTTMGVQYPCFKITYHGDEGEIADQEVVLAEFDYPYSPLEEFTMYFGIVSEVKSTKWTATIELVSPDGERHTIWSKPAKDVIKSTMIVRHASDIMGIYYRNTTRTWFAKKGTYRLVMPLHFEPTKDNASCTVYFITKAGVTFEFKLFGKAFGLLGTNYRGGDVFSEFILGFRISMIIGLVAAMISTAIGTVVGVVSGYLGGPIDEVSMRIVDILMCIPVLPILMIMSIMFGRSIWYILLVIGVFWWLGLSRMIRSQVLSLREMPFVECARASGGSKAYIMFRHIIPNVLPLAMTDFVLSVPGAIMLESGLSFIGYGDPSYATWGRMLQRAMQYGAFTYFKWWYFIPPGLGIILVCLTFVFMGHALDEIVNPRLRRRR